LGAQLGIALAIVLDTGWRISKVGMGVYIGALQRKNLMLIEVR